jgi:hypothetical protein
MTKERFSPLVIISIVLCDVASFSSVTYPNKVFQRIIRFRRCRCLKGGSFHYSAHPINCWFMTTASRSLLKDSLAHSLVFSPVPDAQAQAHAHRMTDVVHHFLSTPLHSTQPPSNRPRPRRSAIPHLPYPTLPYIHTT